VDVLGVDLGQGYVYGLNIRYKMDDHVDYLRYYDIWADVIQRFMILDQEVITI